MKEQQGKAEQKAKELVNEKYYQPLTLHLNLNNNSKQMWEYAKRCALICVDEILFELTYIEWESPLSMDARRIFWQSVKTSINNL